MVLSTMRWMDWIYAHAPEPLAPLAVALAMSAIATGDRLDRGEHAGIRQSEETITETVLLDLVGQIPLLKVKTFRRDEEAENGADWEWWIEGQKQWFHFLVQAKRIHAVTGGAYYDIGYRPRSRGNVRRARQVDTLLKSAKETGTPAIYVLYNQARAVCAPYAQPHCWCWPLVEEGIDGITALSAFVARRVLGPDVDKSTSKVPLNRVRQHAVPWSCLATCFGGVYAAGPWWHGWNPDVFGQRYANGEDPALAARDFVLSLDQTRRSRQSWEDQDAAVGLVRQGMRDQPAGYVPARLSEGLSESNSQPHPLSESRRAPRFVAALYRE